MTSIDSKIYTVSYLFWTIKLHNQIRIHITVSLSKLCPGFKELFKNRERSLERKHFLTAKLYKPVYNKATVH